MLEFFVWLSPLEQCLYCVLAVTFLYQLLVWLGFSTVAGHRHPIRLKPGDSLPAVSIVVVVGDSQDWYLQEGLPELLAQQYDGQWEVVVVNDCGGIEISDALVAMSAQYPQLRHTELKADLKVSHSSKVPLLVGIKAAKHPNILFSDPSVEVGRGWLNLMARGFVGGDVVIGYSGFVPSCNRFIRSSRLMHSLRYLRTACDDRPYSGIYNNIGYTSKAFFAANGFTHLRLNTGVDDLFIQKLHHQGARTSVILNPNCTARQYPLGGLSWWWSEQRYRTYTFRHYPLGVRFRIFMELLTKLLFLVSVAWLGAVSVGEIMHKSVCLPADAQWWQVLTVDCGWIVALCAFGLREWAVGNAARRFCKRVGEEKLVGSFMLYELVCVVSETLLGLARRFLRVRSVWR